MYRPPLGLLALLLLSTSALAQSDAGPLVERLKSGKLPPEKQVIAIRLICQRGNADDLGYILAQSADPKAFAPANRAAALDGLEDAVLTRKVQPKTTAGLKALVGATDEPTRIAALRLAGLWKDRGIFDEAKTLALTADTPEALRAAAITALVGMGGEDSFAVLGTLLGGATPLKVRYLAAAGRARISPEKAGTDAAEALASGNDRDDPAPLIAAFLDQKNGADILARALKDRKPNGDAARMALRFMYGVGRSDAALTEALSLSAGIPLKPVKPTPAELKTLADEVLATGDAVRGEAIFRRLDLSCARCHAISGAGGNVGPDLRGIGAISPPDYLLRAILDPAADVKEEFLAQQIVTGAGKIFLGIVVEEDAQKVVLRDAVGEKKTIQIADIDERSKGGSLMPAGLANFLTRRELVDLVRYLNETGKPGPYALPAVASIRRWRVLREVPAALLTGVPDASILASEVLAAGPTKWLPAYAKTSGLVPLDEVSAATGKKVLYLQGEIELTAEGAVALQFDNPAGVSLWIGDRPTKIEKPTTLDLPTGKHAITLRIDLVARGGNALRVDLVKPAGSTAEFTPVGGP